MFVLNRSCKKHILRFVGYSSINCAALKRNGQSLVLLQIFDRSLGGVRNRLTVVVQQRDQTRQRFLRVKSLERPDRGNAHRRTLIVKSVKQRPNGTSITDLSQRP